MSVEIIDCVQGSPEWFTHRLGIPTASNFNKVMANPRGNATEAKTRFKYLNQLASETVTGNPTTEVFRNEAMDRGKRLEPEARRQYALETDTDPQLIGFAKNGRIGASPDALIGQRGALEIKTAEQDILFDILIRDAMPPAHIPQCQGNILVLERDWIDCVIYCPGMRMFKKRIYRDDNYIARMQLAINVFLEDLDTMVGIYRKRYGDSHREGAAA